MKPVPATAAGTRSSLVLVTLPAGAGVLFRGAAALTARGPSAVRLLTASPARFSVLGGRPAAGSPAVPFATFLVVSLLALGSTAPPSPGFGRFLLVPLVRGPALVGGPTALDGNLPLFLGIHRGKAPLPAPRTARVLVGFLRVTLGTLAVLVGGHGVPPAVLMLAGLVVLGRLAVVVGGRLVVVGRVVVRGVPALAADFGHVLAVAAYGLATLAAGLGRLFRIEFVSVAALVRGSPPRLAISRCSSGSMAAKPRAFPLAIV